MSLAMRAEQRGRQSSSRLLCIWEERQKLFPETKFNLPHRLDLMMPVPSADIRERDVLKVGNQSSVDADLQISPKKSWKQHVSARKRP